MALEPWVSGRDRVETQAVIADDDADLIAGRFAISRDRLTPLIDRLLRIGPELLSESAPGHFADAGQAARIRPALEYVPARRPPAQKPEKGVDVPLVP